MQRSIYVVGYYRSGTSALSGALDKLGVNFNNEASVNEHNPLGFYEVPELISFDIDVFQKMNYEWCDVVPLPEQWLERIDISGMLPRLEAIIKKLFGDGNIIGIKHPHLCHLLPMYLKASDICGIESSVVHIFRDPYTSAASQKLKNKLSSTHALLLWMQYATQAELNARQTRRSWATYQNLLANPRKQILQIESDLGFELTSLRSNGLRDAENYLTEQLNRSRPVEKEDIFPDLRLLVDDTWAAIQDKDYHSSTWDSLRNRTNSFIGFLSELKNSSLRVMPGVGEVETNAVPTQQNMVQIQNLRPPERCDEATKSRLLNLLSEQSNLPSVGIAIAIPKGKREEALQTIASLEMQWHQANQIIMVTAEPLNVDGFEVRISDDVDGRISELICDTLNDLAKDNDYVAVIDAGDLADRDAVARFILASSGGVKDLIYCDEVVTTNEGRWVRYKPGWDKTRLRGASYIGDWAWYKSKTVNEVGGFRNTYPGAEEYDIQLRFANRSDIQVEQLAETLFIDAPNSIRDHFTIDELKASVKGCAEDALGSRKVNFGSQEAQNIEVADSDRLGLVRYHVNMTDTTTPPILFMVKGLNADTIRKRLNNILGGQELSTPIIISAYSVDDDTRRYLRSIYAAKSELGNYVQTVNPDIEIENYGQALRHAFDLIEGEHKHVMIMDGSTIPHEKNWINILRSKFVCSNAGIVSAKTTIPVDAIEPRFMLQGPIVIGALHRLGNMMAADDPGIGAWMIVDQEASAVAPGCLAVERKLFDNITFSSLSGDAFWIDICAQVREMGKDVIWTPDATFFSPIESIETDKDFTFRQGSKAAKALSWRDPYHHPGLSLHRNLLGHETRHGLALGMKDPKSFLYSGLPVNADAILNATRTLRKKGQFEVNWANEPFTKAEFGRRAPDRWIRVNPTIGQDGVDNVAAINAPFDAICTYSPGEGAVDILRSAGHIYTTSPGLQMDIENKLGGQSTVNLWRPRIERALWEDLEIGFGLNTRPRVVWMDDGKTMWMHDLINETKSDIAWIIIERPGTVYSGSVAKMPNPGDEATWAKSLGTCAPQIFLRPSADDDVLSDCYHTLVMAVAGAHILVDQRLDTPEELKCAVRLNNDYNTWKLALGKAVLDLKSTLEFGKENRNAVLAMPAIEDETAPWLI